MKKKFRHNTILAKLFCIMLVISMLPCFVTNAEAAETGADTVGDVDGDGSITPKDVTKLRRYLAGGWDVEVATKDGDVDEDGAITPKDVTKLRRYLAGGWGIELPEKTSHEPLRNKEGYLIDGYWMNNDNRSGEFIYQEKDENENTIYERHISLDGNVIEVDEFSSGKLVSAEYGSAKYYYDQEGNQTKVIYSDGKTVLCDYDDNGNIQRAVVSSAERNGEVEYSYDTEGNLLSVVSNYIYTDGRKEITEEYYEVEKLAKPDEFGRTSSTVLSKALLERPNGTKAVYEKGTETITLTSTDGTVTTYKNEYNEAGKPLKKFEFNVYWATYTDNLENGITTFEYEYDSENRVVNEIQDHQYGKKYVYDTIGNKIREISYYIEGVPGFENIDEEEIINFEYDESGRLIREYSSLGNNFEKFYNAFGLVDECIRTTWSDIVFKTKYYYDTDCKLIRETEYKDDVLQSEIEYINGKKTKQTKVEEIYSGEFATIVFYYDENGIVVKSTIISSDGYEYKSVLGKDDLGRILQFPYDSADDVDSAGRASGHLNIKFVDKSNLKTMIVWRDNGEPGEPSSLWREEYIFDLKNKTYTYCNNGIADHSYLIYYELSYDDNWDLVKKKEKIYDKDEGKALIAELEWNYDSDGNEILFSVTGSDGKRYDYDMSRGNISVKTIGIDWNYVCGVFENDEVNHKTIITYHSYSGETTVEEA